MFRNDSWSTADAPTDDTKLKVDETGPNQLLQTADIRLDYNPASPGKEVKNSRGSGVSL